MKDIFIGVYGNEAVLLVGCCCGDEMTEHVADGETYDCLKGQIWMALTSSACPYTRPCLVPLQPAYRA